MMDSIDTESLALGIPFLLGALVGFLLLARRLRALAATGIGNGNRAMAKRWGRATIGLAVLWGLVTLWYATVPLPLNDDATDVGVSLLVTLVCGAPAHISVLVAVRRAVQLLRAEKRSPGSVPTAWFRSKQRLQALLEWIQAHRHLASSLCCSNAGP